MTLKTQRFTNLILIIKIKNTMICGDNIKHRCGNKQYASCVYYELTVPEISSLVDEDCITIEETTEDLYQIITNLNSSIDVSQINTDSLTLPSDFTIKDLVEAQNNKISELEEEVENLNEESICDKSIEECGLDLGTLLDDCGEPVTTLGQALQIIFNNLQTP